MRDALVDLKRPSNGETNHLPELHFRLCSVIYIFVQNKSVITQTNYILLRGTHYSSKPESMNEIDFSRFATDFEGCLIVTDIHS